MKLSDVAAVEPPEIRKVDQQIQSLQQTLDQMRARSVKNKNHDFAVLEHVMTKNDIVVEVPEYTESFIEYTGLTNVLGRNMRMASKQYDNSRYILEIPGYEFQGNLTKLYFLALPPVIDRKKFRLIEILNLLGGTMSQDFRDAKEKLRLLLEKRKMLKIKIQVATLPAPTGKSTIPTTSIPKLIPNNKRGFDNPYWSAVPGTEYAGHPDDFDFSATGSNHYVYQYHQLKDLLASHNIAPFTVLYAGNHTRGSWRKKPIVEFVAIGANGKLIWRKFGVGAGAQNILVFLGKGRTNYVIVPGSALSTDMTQWFNSIR